MEAMWMQSLSAAKLALAEANESRTSLQIKNKELNRQLLNNKRAIGRAGSRAGLIRKIKELELQLQNEKQHENRDAENDALRAALESKAQLQQELDEVKRRRNMELRELATLGDANEDLKRQLQEGKTETAPEDALTRERDEAKNARVDSDSDSAAPKSNDDESSNRQLNEAKATKTELEVSLLALLERERDEEKNAASKNNKNRNSNNSHKDEASKRLELLIMAMNSLEGAIASQDLLQKENDKAKNALREAFQSQGLFQKELDEAERKIKLHELKLLKQHSDDDDVDDAPNNRTPSQQIMENEELKSALKGVLKRERNEALFTEEAFACLEQERDEANEAMFATKLTLNAANQTRKELKGIITRLRGENEGLKLKLRNGKEAAMEHSILSVRSEHNARVAMAAMQNTLESLEKERDEAKEAMNAMELEHKCRMSSLERASNDVKKTNNAMEMDHKYTMLCLEKARTQVVKVTDDMQGAVAARTLLENERDESMRAKNAIQASRDLLQKDMDEARRQLDHFIVRIEQVAEFQASLRNENKELRRGLALMMKPVGLQLKGGNEEPGKGLLMQPDDKAKTGLVRLEGDIDDTRLPSVQPQQQISPSGISQQEQQQQHLQNHVPLLAPLEEPVTTGVISVLTQQQTDGNKQEGKYKDTAPLEIITSKVKQKLLNMMHLHVVSGVESEPTQQHGDDNDKGNVNQRLKEGEGGGCGRALPEMITSKVAASEDNEGDDDDADDEMGTLVYMSSRTAEARGDVLLSSSLPGGDDVLNDGEFPSCDGSSDWQDRTLEDGNDGLIPVKTPANQDPHRQKRPRATKNDSPTQEWEKKRKSRCETMMMV